MFEGRLFTDEETDRKVEAYIRENYSFMPTWEFVAKSPDGRKETEILMPYRELDKMVVERLLRWAEEIKSANGKGRRSCS